MERIIKALETTKRLLPGYFEKTLASRQPATAIGSRFLQEVTEMDLMHAVWSFYEHPAIAPECIAFSTNIPGILGIVALADLDSNVLIRLDDHKETGMFSALVTHEEVFGEFRNVDFTVIILGPEEGQEVIYTVHPGAPISASTIPSSENCNKLVLVEEAIALGFTYAKVV